MTLPGRPSANPTGVPAHSKEGSTLPYGKDPSVVPAKSELDPEDRKHLRWRGTGQAADSGQGAPPPSASGEWVPAPAAAAPTSADPSTYPPLDEGEHDGVILTIGWIEQVLALSLGSDVDVRAAGVGKRWKVRLNEKHLVDIISSMALHVGRVMPNGGTLTVHTMAIEVTPGENSIRLGVKAGSYVFMGISHMQAEDSSADSSGVRKKGPRVGLDTCLRLVSSLGGVMSIDRKREGMTAMNIYLPAVV